MGRGCGFRGLSVYFRSCATLPDDGVVLGGSINGGTEMALTVIIRVDPSGRILWGKKIAGPVPSQLSCIAIGNDASIIGVGSLAAGSETEALWLFAMDPSGMLMWERSYDSQRSEGRTVTIATNGDILLTGVRLYHSLFGGVDVRRAFVLRLAADGTGLWGVYVPPPQDIEDMRTQFPSVVLETSGGSLLAGAEAGTAGMSGSHSLFWSISPSGLPEQAWFVPVMAGVMGGFSRPGTGEDPVLYGNIDYPGNYSGWIWSAPSPNGGGWARKLTGPFENPSIWVGFRASDGDLILSGYAETPGTVMWRTSPEGMMPRCQSTEDLEVSAQASSLSLYRGPVELSPIQDSSENCPTTVEDFSIQTSFVCGDATAAPRIPVLNHCSVILLCSLFMGIGILILRKAQH